MRCCLIAACAYALLPRRRQLRPPTRRRAEPQRFPFAGPFPFGKPTNGTPNEPPPAVATSATGPQLPFASPFPFPGTRLPFDESRVDNVLKALPVDAAQLLPALQRFRERAEGDNYELIQQVSRQAERALSGENPLKLAQGVLGGALAERLPSNVDPRSRALAEKLLRDVDAYPEAAFPPDLVQTVSRCVEINQCVASVLARSSGEEPVSLESERPFLEGATLCASLSSAIYANANARDALRSLGRAHVASGRTHDVAWAVVDGVRDGKLERHVVLRGFDASDDTGDNVLLVKRVLCARPVPIPLDTQVFPRSWDAVDAFVSEENVPEVTAHAGFLFLAESLLDDLAPYLDIAPEHDLIFTGHSIGGALAGLCTVLARTRDDDRILVKPSAIVFAPLPCLKSDEETVLAALDLDETIVRSFVQPWDPLVRWFTAHDPCYPLVADSLDDDIYTLFASGPPRVLRNVARAILAAAEDWPAVRSVYLQEANQTFDHLGVAHVLMPAQAARYLADRLFALVVDFPDEVLLVRCAASDLPEALDHAFQLEEFSISLAPAGLRSFIHHFHPAYSAPLEELVAPSGGD